MNEKIVRSGRVVLVYISVILFGLSSWIGVNGIFSQLPIFAAVLPEKWAVASKMALALQLANIFPVLFLLIISAMPRKYKYNFDTISIYGICILGIVGSVLLGLFWDKTEFIGGEQTSFWMLVFVFLTGSVDCTTSVIYFPFISNYNYLYTSALTVGEGLTGGIVGIVGFIQQPGSEHPRFSVLVFCIILAAVIVLSALAFTFLRFSWIGKSQLRDTNAEREIIAMLVTPRWKLSYTYRLILAQMLISFFENGILVSIGPYLFQNYPNGRQLWSNAINIMLVVDPIACFIAYFVPKRLPLTGLLHVVWISGCLVQIVIAFMSPNVPGKRSLGVGISIVILAVFTRICIAYCKTKEFLIAHERLQYIEEHSIEPNIGSFTLAGKELSTFQLAGFGIQVGALIGSIIMYLLTSNGVLS